MKLAFSSVVFPEIKSNILDTFSSLGSFSGKESQDPSLINVPCCSLSWVPPGLAIKSA